MNYLKIIREMNIPLLKSFSQHIPYIIYSVAETYLNKYIQVLFISAFLIFYSFIPNGT